MKKFFEKHDLFKIASIFVIISVILTWALKYSYFTAGELTTDKINRIGIFDLSTYGLLSLYYFTVAIVFVFVVAGFYKVVGSIPAYQSLTNSVARVFEGKEKVFVALSILCYAVLSSIISDQLVLLAFVPLSITIMSKMKLDKVTAMSSTFGGILIGILGATFSSKIVGQLIDQNIGLKVSYGYEIVAVLIIFAISYILLTFFTFIRMNNSELNGDTVVDMFNSNKAVLKRTVGVTTSAEPVKVESKNVSNKKFVKNDKNKKSALLAKEVEEVRSVKVRKVNVIPMIIVLCIMFIILILGFINWEASFNISIFTDFHKWITSATIFDIPIFQYILGNSFKEFGNWDLFVGSSVLLFFLLIIKVLYRVKLDDLLDKFGDGLKLINKTVLIMLLIYLILEINVIFPTIPLVIKSIIGFGNNFATQFASSVLTSLFTVDFQYTMSLIGSYFATFNDSNIAALALQTGYGFVSFVAPTSLVLMVGLSMLDIKYKDWLKHIWMFMSALLVIILIVLAILKFV